MGQMFYALFYALPSLHLPLYCDTKRGRRMCTCQMCLVRVYVHKNTSNFCFKFAPCPLHHIFASPSHREFPGLCRPRRYRPGTLNHGLHEHPHTHTRKHTHTHSDKTRTHKHTQTHTCMLSFCKRTHTHTYIRHLHALSTSLCVSVLFLCPSVLPTPRRQKPHQPRRRRVCACRRARR
jgi:hypothetical protein